LKWKEFIKEQIPLLKISYQTNHVKCPPEMHINMRKSHSPSSNFYYRISNPPAFT